MALGAGAKLGPYEILAPIGAGGMGEVYRASDPRLGREVAIKVSAERFSERFEREARVVASLNHPNICTLYDVGPDYLVMELVEGPTLSARLDAGAIPLEEALRIARQIADALEAAHEKGVTHRDLKPANIKLTAEGVVKVLDFGLAKVATAASGELPENSPTLSMAATQAGVILGTAGYMSPEQARGKPVDKRADIWAFGVVLYEMITGRRLFQGEDVSHTMAAVIMQEPRWDGVPPSVERLLKSCLEKDPKKRMRDIGDVWRLLETPAPLAAPAINRAGSKMTRMAVGAAAVLAVVAAGVSWIHFREQPPPTPIARFSIPAPDGTAFSLSVPTQAPVAVSPDGKRLVFGAGGGDGSSQLWVRSLDTLAAMPLAGTKDATFPFWSPDSQSIGFFADGKLKKIAATGGAAITLCPAPQGRGGAWSPEGVIVFASEADGALSRVSEAGGAASPATSLDKKRNASSQRWPWFLPDGRHFLYLEQGAAQATGTAAAVRVASLDSNGTDSAVLLENDFNAIYAQGHLLFLHDGTLMAQPFDAKRLALSGQAVPVAEQVADVTLRLGVFSASANGILVYRKGTAVEGVQLAWYDRTGKPAGRLGDPGLANGVHLSPDSKSATVSLVDPSSSNRDIWLYDVVRGIKTRFTFDPAEERESVWSPDSRMVVFNSNRKGRFDLYRKPSNLAGNEELLYADDIDKYPTSLSPDGKFLLYYALKSKASLWILPLADGKAAGKPTEFAPSAFNLQNGRFSPDGHWIAYTSNESQRLEIYVAPFPGPGGKRQISLAGGANPIWRPDGKEIFYRAADGMLTAAEVTIKGGILDVGAVRPLFGPILVATGNTFDVSADGQRFLVRSAPAQNPSSEPLTLVQNWAAALKK